MMRPSMNVTGRQYAALARRAVVNVLRQPATSIPSLVFPLIFMAMSAAALNRSIALPGFPEVDSFVQFAIAATIVQGVLFGSIAAGSEMAKDIEDGFFERLVASPVSRTSILVGRVAGAASLGFVQALIFLSVGMIFGVDVEGGAQAFLLIAIVASVLSAAIGSVAVAIGLRTGSSEAVQGTFPLLFALMFLSSAFFPRDLMNGWFRSVASVNPLSHLIEGLRTQIIRGVDLGQWTFSLLIALGIFAIGITLARLALRGRLGAVHL